MVNMTEDTAPQSSPLSEQGETPGAPRMTPANLQRTGRLRLRRVAMLSLNLLSLGALLYAVSRVFGADGLSALEWGMMFAITLSAPWTILGFWNAVLGLILALRRDGGLGAVAPFVAATPSDAPLRTRTAILLTLRNEQPERAFARLLAVRASLDATGQGGAFDTYILSDTDDKEVAAEEERLFAGHRAALAGAGNTQYRRRSSNEGYKAGNVWDFVTRWGDEYEFFLPLDADSAMSGPAILSLARMMEQHPRIGILQSLAVGAPNDSAFGRIFQFGMRHGMSGFTLGSAWWQGDCGPFWGHNALVRAAPFKAFCKLPELGGTAPWGGPILSHDQVEATLMRAGGYEVRVTPVESESYEDNPVTLLDFMKREQRWCNGNMQYWRLLTLPGLTPTSRFQLFQAIMMYLSGPAWMLLTALGMVMAMTVTSGVFNGALAIGPVLHHAGMSMAPKLVGAVHVALRPGGIAQYGGTGRFLGGMALETVFSILMSPAVALRLTIFLIGLCFGQRIGWNGQIRDAYGLNWSTAIKELWPQSLAGAAMIVILSAYAPGALPWAAPVYLGLLLAPVFAVVYGIAAIGRVVGAA